MDIYCPICGEPWDFDSLHEEAQERYGIPYYMPDNTGAEYGQSSYNKTKNPKYNSDDYQKVYKRVSAEFRSKGCAALSFASPCKPESEDAHAERDAVFGLTKSEASSALYDILGDDLDGAAAMMEDMGF